MNLEQMKQKTPTSVKRLSGWYLAATVALIIIGLVAHQQIEVLVYKVAQVCVGVLIAYLADRTLFRHAPDVADDMPADNFGGMRLIARALVALAVIVGVTIGI